MKRWISLDRHAALAITNKEAAIAKGAKLCCNPDVYVEGVYINYREDSN